MRNNVRQAGFHTIKDVAVTAAVVLVALAVSPWIKRISGTKGVIQ